MIKIEFNKKKSDKKNKKQNNVKKMEFSKRMLIYDYCIALILLFLLAIGLCINCVYVSITTSNLIQMGMDVSILSTTTPFNLEVIGVVLGVWIGQLAISSGAYFIMAKEDHRVQIPMKLIHELPSDIKETVDMTQIIISALNISTH